MPYRIGGALFPGTHRDRIQARTGIEVCIRVQGEEIDSGNTWRRLHDARQWARHYGQDVFNNDCLNHEHDCKATCVKYVKKRLEAKNSLRSNKVPSCRFWFFRRVKVKGTMDAVEAVDDDRVHQR